MKKSPDAYRKKYGIPNWRDKNAYPAELPETLWRWEFLRRSKDYRKDWETYYPQTVEWLQKHGRERRFTDVWFWLNNHGLDPRGAAFWALMPGSVEKYHLQGLSNPAIREPENLSFAKPIPPGHLETGAITFAFGNDTSFIVSGNRAALCVDLNEPIKPQLDNYEYLFRKLVADGMRTLKIKSDRRRRKTNYQKYLRAYDARSEDATFAEIGKELGLSLYYSEAAARAEECLKAAEKIQMQYIAFPK